ncbi:hypothetical protein [Halorientalis salina]|uniref:hypothetical protein n=1 Tax=Halorientalis salina TaxID=2932266 RepID=UPI0010AC1AB3|nr:hypothetical protein [Halorientalis salina]
MTRADIEYVRVRFTLPNKLAQRLNDLADEQYGGNVSQFLRSAIKDHERTINGRDEFEFQKLRSEVRQLGDQVDQLVDPDEGAALPTSKDDRADCDTTREDYSDGVAVERRVQSCLVESDEGSLSLDKLTELVDAEPLEIQIAVESLLDREYIERDSDNSPVCYRICAP